VPIGRQYGLPFVNATLLANGLSVALSNVIIDTGSASSIFSADKMLDIGLFCSAEDQLFIISGVVGEEYVFSKTIHSLGVGNLSILDFKIEVGAMDYGFQFDGILGMDFLLLAKATLDFKQMVIKD